MATDDPTRQVPKQTPAAPGNAAPDSPQASPRARAMRCDEWESLAAEAVEQAWDESLAPGQVGRGWEKEPGGAPAEAETEVENQAEIGAEIGAFDRHRLQCPSCARKWDEMGRGAEWLRMLDRRPQPPEGLIEAILASTSGAGLQGMPAPAAKPAAMRARPSGGPAGVPPLPGMAGPRRPPMAAAPSGWIGHFATAAMAFFSVAITLFLVGGSARPIWRAVATPGKTAMQSPQIRLANLANLSNLRPSAIEGMVSRRYYSLEERGAQFYDNLLLVREVEADVRDLSPSGETEQNGNGAPSRLSPPAPLSPRSQNGEGASPAGSRRQAAVSATAGPGNGTGTGTWSGTGTRTSSSRRLA